MRRIGCIVTLLIVVLLLAAVGWLAWGLIGDPRDIASGDPEFVSLLAAAPPEATVLITRDAGPFWTSLQDDVTIGALVRENSGKDLDLAALVLGRSPVAVWRSGEVTGFAASPGPLRGGLIQMIGRFSDSIPPLERRGELLVSGAGTGLRPQSFIPPVEGSAILVHGADEEGWPPGLDAIATAITRNARDELVLRTVGAPVQSAMRPGTFPFEIPVDAPLSAMFWEPVPALRQFGKILPVDISALSDDGVAVVIFNVDSGGLIPTLEGVILVPATDHAKQSVAQLFNTALFPQELGLLAGEVSSRQVGSTRIDRIERLGSTIETATLGGTLVIAIDRRSMDRYLSAQRTPHTPGATTSWRLISDLDKLSPLLATIEDDRALRLVARDFQRSVRDFRRNVQRLRGASNVVIERRNEPARALVDLTVSPE